MHYPESQSTSEAEENRAEIEALRALEPAGTPARQRILRQNERAFCVFLICGLLVYALVLLAMFLRWNL